MSDYAESMSGCNKAVLFAGQTQIPAAFGRVSAFTAPEAAAAKVHPVIHNHLRFFIISCPLFVSR